MEEQRRLMMMVQCPVGGRALLQECLEEFVVGIRPGPWLEGRYACAQSTDQRSRGDVLVVVARLSAVALGGSLLG